MKFGWLIYITGIIAIGIAIGFLTSISEFAAISLMFLLFVWFFLFPFIATKKAVKKARIPLEELINSPEQIEIVKVFKKATEMSGGNFIAGDDGNGTASFTTPVITLFFISFEFPDGARKNFSVDVNQYNCIAENETGTLTYKKHKNDLMFIDFQSQS